MTNEERDIIASFIARVGGAAPGPDPLGGSVPATTQPALPPMDRGGCLHRELLNRFPRRATG